MQDNVPSPGKRITTVCDRLYEVLGAGTAQEGEVIRFVTRALPIEAAELLATMVEREVKRATADGYERGWR